MKVSIITVSFNSASTIEKTIRSVINQDYNDIEYIIIDGGSSDGTCEIIERYSDYLTYWVSESDDGIYDAMNKGIEQVQGDIIAILNSDDYYVNEEIIKQVVKVFQNHDIEGVFTSIKIVDAEGVVVRRYPVQYIKKWMLRFGIAPPHPGAFMSASVYQKIGAFNKNYRIGADFDFLTKFFQTFKDYKKLNIVSVAMLHGGVSTRGINSYSQSSKDIINSLNHNRIYSNTLLVWLRLPIKYLLHLLT